MPVVELHDHSTLFVEINYNAFLAALYAGKNRGKVKMCGPVSKPKTVYSTQEAAFRACVKMNEAWEKNLAVWPCVYCHKWHICAELTTEEKEKFWPNPEFPGV